MQALVNLNGFIRKKQIERYETSYMQAKSTGHTDTGLRASSSCCMRGSPRRSPSHIAFVCYPSRTAFVVRWPVTHCFLTLTTARRRSSSSATTRGPCARVLPSPRLHAAVPALPALRCAGTQQRPHDLPPACARTLAMRAHAAARPALQPRDRAAATSSPA